MTSARPLSAADHEDLLDTDGSPDWDYTPGESQPFEFKAIRLWTAQRAAGRPRLFDPGT